MPSLRTALALVLLAGCYRADAPRGGPRDADAPQEAGAIDAGEEARSDASDASEDAATADATEDASVEPAERRWSFAHLYGDALPQSAEAIAVRPDGAHVVVGLVAGIADFGTGPIGPGALVSRAFVASFGAPREFTPGWARTFAGDPAAVAVDDQGRVTVVGSFVGSSDAGGAALTASGGRDGLLATYDATGAPLAGLAIGGVGVDHVRDVALASNGDRIVVGGLGTGSVVDLGGTPLATQGSEDAFLAAFSPTNELRYALRWGDASSQTARSVAVHAASGLADSVVVAGDYTGTMAFISGSLSSSGGRDAYVVTFDAAGNDLKAYGFGGPGDQTVSAVAVDPFTGCVAIGGQFEGTMTLGGETLVSEGGRDGFVAVFQPGGWGSLSLLFARRFGDALDQFVADVALDASSLDAGHLYVVGGFEGSFTWDGITRTSRGGHDLFAMRLALGGALTWLETAGDDAEQSLLGVGTDTSNFGYVVGGPWGSGRFDDATLTAVGSSDAFLGRLVP